MSRPLRITYPGAFYHITSRGNEQKAVFKSRQDRTKFLEYLKSASERYGAVIHAYCMLDHYLSINIQFYLCRKYTVKPLSEIGAYFNIGDSGVSKVYGRLSQRIEKDKKLKSKINKIIKSLNLSMTPIFALKINTPRDYTFSGLEKQEQVHK